MANNVESIYDRRRKVHDAIQAGWIDSRVVDLLLENGKGTNDEAPLWDYKASLPIIPQHKNDALSREIDAKLAEIVKDSVAFYNSYGGYILVGVDDSTREVVGFNADFSAADLNKKIDGAVGISIETIFRIVDMSHIRPNLSVGLLLIPKRPSGINPAQFRRAASASPTGKVAYAAQSFYLRERDNCRPAKSPEDYEFLYGSRAFGYSADVGRFLDSNLPDRDPELVQLIGRQEEMASLWSWLSDEFSPIKILSGLGGLGKTSISYTFSERLIDRAPVTLDRLIWLGAKTETFSGEMNRDVTIARVDFETVEQLLIQLLLESGCPEPQIPENPEQRELMELCRDHLSANNYIIIVDNVDTLDDSEQQVVFHLLTQLCSPTNTKCIITARRNLGAPKSVVVEVGGLLKEDFFKFVEEKCPLFKVTPPSRDSTEMKTLFESSGGSPLFALSILRLVGLGDSLRNAINHWKGSDGETVRDAAFKREVGRLKRNEARTLLALCYRKRASSVELASLLGLTRYEVQSAIEELQSFSMTTTDNSLPGGAIFSIPETLKLVTPIVEKRVADHAEIKKACLKSVEISRNKRPYIADAVIRAMAFLDQKQVSKAIEVVESALKSLPEDPDLLCLRGRCLQAKGDYDRAGDAFQQAYDLGCRKRELFVGWSAVAEDHDDWKAMIEVSRLADAHIPSLRSILSRNYGRAQLGHERCRGGDYKGAIEFYEEALGELRAATNKFHGAGDRIELSKQRELLAVSWLGAVQQSAAQGGDDGRRVFGAYHKAIVMFRLQSPNTFMSAVGVLTDWVRRVEQRQLVSVTARENLILAKSRLSTLQEIVEANKRFGDNFAGQFNAAAARLHKEIARLVA